MEVAMSGARVDVTLKDEERQTLERWARRPKSSQALALRCRIVLGAAAGEQSRAIAERLGCTPSTVGKWRGRVARMGLGGPPPDARPGPRDALVDPLDGGRDRPQPDGDQPDLAGLRLKAAADRTLQALRRPAVHRQGPRHRRAVLKPARGGRRALRR